MTTKHVVADGALGQVSRKQWEIQRRILEGTLDPNNVALKLQKIIEGASLDVFPIETICYSLSGNSYDVKVRVRENIIDAIRATTNSIGTFLENRDATEEMVAYSAKECKRTTLWRKLLLAKITEPTPVDVVQVHARISDHTLADGWDLLAFIAQARVMLNTQDGMRIHALGGNSILAMWNKKYRLDGSDGVRQHYLMLHGISNSETRGWRLNLGDLTKNNHVLGNRFSDYILLRDR